MTKVKSKYVVLYFYPKDDTPGCTLETKDFNLLLSKFNKLKCKVYGISKDSLKSHKKFKEKYKVKFDLNTFQKDHVYQDNFDKNYTNIYLKSPLMSLMYIKICL